MKLRQLFFPAITIFLVLLYITAQLLLLIARLQENSKEKTEKKR
jgi:hypothetical protein